MKRSGKHSDVKVRELPPKVRETPAGVEVLCPFCDPPHPILPNVDSACGTTLKVTAVQTVLTAHGSRQQGIKCIKCHQTGGEMVRFNNSFVHLVDCMPGVKLLTTPPKFDKWAGRVLHLPKWLRKPIEKSTGAAQAVKEIDQDGKETGKTLGYFFLKGS